MLYRRFLFDDRMTDNCFTLFWGTFSRITEIDLMMESIVCKIHLIAILIRKFMHGLNGSRFRIIGPYVHALYTNPFGV